MLIKQLSRCQARWSEFLSRFNYCIAYHFNKIDDKLNALTCHSKNLFKEKNTFNSWHQYQHQTILKTYVLDFNIVKNLTLDVFNIKIMKFQSQIIALDSIQLHLFSVISAFLQILVLMNLKIEEFNVEDERWRCWVSAKSRYSESWWRFCWHFHSDIVKASWNQW